MLPDGRVIAGRFRILGPIGAGPHGVVYRADDAGQPVALKVVDEPDEERAAALVEGARRVAALDHPGLARVRAAGRDGGTVWVACDLAPGQSLAVALEEGGALPVAEAVRVLVAVCEALAVTHAAGVLHGDLKPENVIVGPDGAVRLTDVGLARSRGAPTSEYASPEASHGYPEDGRSDLYSLGLLAYELLAGQAFCDDADACVILPEAVSPAVRSVVIRLLHKDRAARFRRAADVAEALAGAAAGGLARPRRVPRRRGVGVALLAGGILAVALVLVVRGRGAVRHVVVNGAELAAPALTAYEERVGGAVPDGRYWYDRLTGAWGREGKPARCVTAAGLDLGPASRAGAAVRGLRACPLGQEPP